MKKYVSTSAGYNLVCLIDHASFINFDTSIYLTVLHYKNKFIRQGECMKMYMF